MKKLSYLYLLASSLLFIAFNTFAQVGGVGSACVYKNETKRFVKSVDSLSNFLQQIQNVASASEWDGFLKDVNSGTGLNSFDNFGSSSTQFQNEYNTFCQSIDVKYKDLIAAVDPGNTMSPDEIKQQISQDVKCYLKDTVENSLESMFNVFNAWSSLNAPPEGGPCEIALRSCADNAENEFTRLMTSCFFGGGGIGAIKGWWGVGTGVICIITAGIRKNRAIGTCLDNYVDCIGG